MRILILTIAALILSGCDNQAFAYSDEQLAMAIYHAEGGSASKYPFGIRSVYCGSYANCKVICKTTIRHNRNRFAQDGRKGNKPFITYLADRYCPSTGRANAQREHDNWINNVNAFIQG